MICFEAHAADIPSLVQRAKPAVVQIIASDANWSPIKTGTGFFVSADGDLLTNFHVIQGAIILVLAPTKAPFLSLRRLLPGSADSDSPF